MHIDTLAFCKNNFALRVTFLIVSQQSFAQWLSLVPLKQQLLNRGSFFTSKWICTKGDKNYYENVTMCVKKLCHRAWCVHCWHMPTSRESPAQLYFLKHQGVRLVTLSRGSWKASSLKLKIYPKSYILSSTVSIIKCQTQFMGACPAQILGSEVDVK